MKSNPFDISFGKKPNESISRIAQSKEILDTFTSNPITQQIFMITGVRGSGKTVLMNNIANELEDEPDWIVIRLNPDRDLLQALGAKLCSSPACLDIFRSAKINLSMFGISLEVEGALPISDIEAVIERMLKSLKKKHKRVLVTIDEVTNSSYIKTFAGSFQIFVGQELPIFLLMTGLYENIYKLQNEKSLTFLYRAPKIKMEPLNLQKIVSKYEKVFSISADKAQHLANLTNGYPFAFQALGYSYWNHADDDKEWMSEYRQLLEEFIYEKVWSELSYKDKLIASGIANCQSGLICDINAYLGLKEDEINQYRHRLIMKGIVNGNEHGRLVFVLPLFEDFIKDHNLRD